jgi:hypothetical protein
MTDEATLTKRRIEACVMQAQMNAKTVGGDNATAIMDLICAAILLTKMSGGDPDRAINAVKGSARAVVEDFWPKGRAQ